MSFHRLLAAGAVIVAAGTLVAAVPQDGATALRPATSTAQPARPMFTIDGTHSMALFRVQHQGAGMFWGRINGVSGMIAFDGPDDPKGPSFDVSIDMDTIDTGSTNLDGHLKNADFFDVPNHPAMTFRSSKATKTGDKTWDVTGTMQMCGVEKEVTANVEWTGSANMGRGNKCGFEATFTIKRSEFGVDYGVAQGALGDETRVIVALEAVERGAGGGGARRGGGNAAGGGGGGLGRLAQHDENKDGKIQKDEMPSELSQLFDRLDANDDGEITEEEMQNRRSGGNRRGGGGG